MVPGTVVGGRYRLDSVLGAGGMGVVWAATHTITHKPVALKFLRGEKADATLRQRFLREARAACAVRHRNVAEIHDVFETDDGTPMMVMELLEGETLAARLKREGRQPLAEVARILMQLASGVGTAHYAGIVHRDLKPDNVFLARTTEGTSVVKILDFGIAKLTSADGVAAITSALTTDGSMLGTPYYMSPEQADGEKDVDYRSDIWSVGVILYEALSGVLPTVGENLGQVFKSITRGTFAPLSQLVPDLPADIVELARRMMSRDRAERPTMNEVCAVLRGYTDEPEIPFGDAAVAPTQRGSSLHPSGAPIPLRLTPVAIAASVSPLARSLGEAETLAASSHSLPSATARKRRASRVLLGLGAVLAAGALGLFAWRLSPTAAAPVPAPRAWQAAASSETLTQPQAREEPSHTLGSQPPAEPAPSEAPAGSAHAPIAAGSSHPAKPRAEAAPPPTPSAAPSVSARPGGVFEQVPF